MSRERVLRAAVRIADEGGLDAVTMRAVATAVDVEAMSLYHHVANKQALLDGLVDTIVQECLDEVDAATLPNPAEDWRGHLRARILTARVVMLRHRWAPALIESTTALSAPVLVWMDAVLATLRAGGFSWDLAHHTMHAIGSRALGFQTELFAPDDGEDADVDVAQMAAIAPTIVEMLGNVVHDDPDTTIGWCDDQTEFEFSLDVMLDGLQARLPR